MGLSQNYKIQEYVDMVCAQIKYSEVHEDIKSELENHIVEMTEEYISQGISEGEAIDKALCQMGDAVTIGRQLNETHKARPEWSLLVLTVLFVSFGLITIYFIETKGALYSAPSSMFLRSLISSLLGICAAVFLYFFDYRKIEKYSKYIYIITLLLLIFTDLKGRPVRGMPWISIGPLHMNFISICSYLFVIALAGILVSLNWDNLKEILYALILIIIPLFFILVSRSFSDTVTYSAVIIALTLVSAMKSKLKFILPGLLAGSGIGLFALYLINEPYRMARFFFFIHPDRDPSGMGYIYLQLSKVIHSAGPLGQGFTFQPKVMPEVHTDFIFSYITYTFGWAAAAIFIILAAAYIIRLGRTALVIKNDYGKVLISGFTAIIATEFLWNILMTLGLAPISGVSLPFISYGGSQLIMNMTSLGLILGIYRRKDIVKVSISS